MKSTKKKAPKGVKTQTACSGKEACLKGMCFHPKPWWFVGK